MEFLVRMANHFPAEEASRREELRVAERRRAMELREQGLLVKLWRLPGTTTALGLWEAPDATTLHEALTSLPQFPWLDITVEPLATHPQEVASPPAR